MVMGRPTTATMTAQRADALERAEALRMEVQARKREEIRFALKVKELGRQLRLLIVAEYLPEAMTVANAIEAEAARRAGRLEGKAA